MSNSKLTSEQKQFRKEFKNYSPCVVFFSFPEMGATVAMRETGQNMAEFSVSIMSNTEQKFRRKVGEYHAAIRMYEGQFLPVRILGNMAATAYDIATAVSAS
jgi:hypothetical protein